MKAYKGFSKVLPFLCLVLITAYLYYVFYKPVEGFFAKSDACDMIQKNRTFIQGQVDDVSKNLSNLQDKVTTTNTIGTEILDYLDKNACFSMNKTDTTCTSLWTQYTGASSTISSVKTTIANLTSSIADLTKQLTTVQGRMDAWDKNKSGGQYTPKEFFEQLKCTANSADNTCKVLTQMNNQYISDTATKPTLTNQITAQNTALTNAQTQLRNTQSTKINAVTSLTNGGCLTYKTNFFCSELLGQYNFLQTTIKNAQTNQQGFLSFFNTRRTPLDDIIKLQTDAC